MIATSTAEAESSRAIGLKSLQQDLAETLTIKIGVDASAGWAIASRRGLVLSKHVQVQYSWVQSLVQEDSIVLTKIPGEENRSDMIHETYSNCQKEFVDNLEYVYLDGHSSSALKAT